MKRKYETLEIHTPIKKICKSQTECINNQFSRIYWPEIIHYEMGSKKLLEKVYSTYTSQMHLMAQFMNLYNNNNLDAEIMCKLFSLVLEIEKSNTL